VKVVFDENLPPALSRAFQCLFPLEHEIIHLRDRFGRGAADIKWISDLSREGRWVLISGDRRITRNRSEYIAFRESRLIGFFLSKGLYKSKVTKQAERILVLWDSMETLAETMQGGAMFELPLRSTRIKQLKL
jgi:hypothetical protein